MPRTSISQNNIKVLHKLSDNEFVGLYADRYGEHACYGWSKGGIFWVYTIGDGHISKIGSTVREVMD